MQLPEIETNSWEITPVEKAPAEVLAHYKPGQWLSRYRAFKLGSPRCSAQIAINWAKERVQEPGMLYTVAGLHRFGVHTLSSCEGHVCCGYPWPSIGIDAASYQALLHVLQSYPLPGWVLVPRGWKKGSSVDTAAWYDLIPEALVRGVSLGDAKQINDLLEKLPLVAEAFSDIPAHVRMCSRSEKDIPIATLQAQREQLIAQLPFYQAQLRHWGIELLEA